jgi:hypothetical protein
VLMSKLNMQCRCVYIIEKKWVGSHIGRFFRKLVRSPCLSIRVYGNLSALTNPNPIFCCRTFLLRFSAKKKKFTKNLPTTNFSNTQDQGCQIFLDSIYQNGGNIYHIDTM